jgi:hypothetical protein
MEQGSAWRASRYLRALDRLEVPYGLVGWCERIEAAADQILRRLDDVEGAVKSSWTITEATRRVRAFAYGEQSRLGRIVAQPLARLKEGSSIRERAQREWQRIVQFASFGERVATAASANARALQAICVEGTLIPALTARLCSAHGLAVPAVLNVRDLRAARGHELRLKRVRSAVRALAVRAKHGDAGVENIAGVTIVEWRALWEVERELFGSELKPRDLKWNAMGRIARRELDAATREMDPDHVGAPVAREMLDRVRTSQERTSGDFRGASLHGHLLALYLLRKYTDWRYTGAAPTAAPSVEATNRDRRTPGAGEPRQVWFLHPIRSRWVKSTEAATNQLAFIVAEVASHVRVWEADVPATGPARIAVGLPGPGDVDVVREALAPFVAEDIESGWYQVRGDQYGKIDILWRDHGFGMARVRYGAAVRRVGRGAVQQGRGVYVRVVEESGDRARDLLEPGAQSQSSFSFAGLELRRVQDLRRQGEALLLHAGDSEQSHQAEKLHRDLGRAGKGHGLAHAGEGLVTAGRSRYPNHVFAEPSGFSPASGLPEPGWYSRIKAEDAALIVHACKVVCDEVMQIGGRLRYVHERMFTYLPSVDVASGRLTVVARLLIAPLAADANGGPLSGGGAVFYERLGFSGSLPGIHRAVEPQALHEGVFALFAADMLCPYELAAGPGEHRTWHALCATLDEAKEYVGEFAQYARVLREQRWLSSSDPERYVRSASAEEALSPALRHHGKHASTENAPETTSDDVLCPAELVEFAAQVHRQGGANLTVRELLAWFGKQRRGPQTLSHIAHAMGAVRIASDRPVWITDLDDALLFTPLEG